MLLLEDDIKRIVTNKFTLFKFPKKEEFKNLSKHEADIQFLKLFRDYFAILQPVHKLSFKSSIFTKTIRMHAYQWLELSKLYSNIVVNLPVSFAADELKLVISASAQGGSLFDLLTILLKVYQEAYGRVCIAK